MLIAEQKKKENIAEYILYMWQMEDLVRGSELAIERVMTKIFPEYDPSDEMVAEYRGWFLDIIEEMKDSGLEKQGHLQTVKRHISMLSELHQSLITAYQDKEYIDLYKKAVEDIRLLKSKSGSQSLSDVEVCLTGLYGLLLLRIQKASISEETMQAMNRIGKVMAHLSESFKRYQSGELSFPPELNN